MAAIPFDRNYDRALRGHGLRPVALETCAFAGLVCETARYRWNVEGRTPIELEEPEPQMNVLVRLG